MKLMTKGSFLTLKIEYVKRIGHFVVEFPSTQIFSKVKDSGQIHTRTNCIKLLFITHKHLSLIKRETTDTRIETRGDKARAMILGDEDAW